MIMDQYEPIDTEEELRESYPWMYEDEVVPYTPPGYKLSPAQEKIRQTELEKLRAERIVAERHGQNFHYTREFTDDMLSTLNFRTYDNLFLARPASAFLVSEDAQQPRKTRRLFSDFWLEGELCVLFADTGCGKSLLAMQVARSLAGGPRFEPFELDAEPGRVLYFDFELSQGQFEKRYSPERDDTRVAEETFPETLVRCPPQPLDALPPGFDNYYDFLIHSIVDLVERAKAKAVVIDNITWLSSSIESSHEALRLMKTLVRLKRDLGISILVLAHTPKRFTRTPITVAHLQGSKMLSNFADSIFAMGTSRLGKNVRYLKGIKHRSSAAREGSAEVATMRIERSGWFLGFRFEGYADERSHIGWSYGMALEAEFASHVERLIERGLTQRELAAELGVSQATVNRCLKARNREEIPVSV